MEAFVLREPSRRTKERISVLALTRNQESEKVTSRWSQGSDFLTITHCTTFTLVFKHVETLQPTLLLIEILDEVDDSIALTIGRLKDKGLPSIPIMALSKTTSEDVVVNAFSSGADRFIHTESSGREFVALAEAVVRRNAMGRMSFGQFSYGPFVLEPTSRKITFKDRTAILTPLEFRFMRFLFSAEGKPVSSQRLFSLVWNVRIADHNDTKRIHAMASRIRVKLNLGDESNWHLGIKRGYVFLQSANE